MRDPALDQGDFVFDVSASAQMEVFKGQMQENFKQSRIEEQNKQQQVLDELNKIKASFKMELQLLKQEREKTKKLQEELIQSRKMQEKLNEQNRSRQNLGTSSMGSQPLPPPLPRGQAVNKWAEIDKYSGGTTGFYKNPGRQKGSFIQSFVNGTRVFVLEKQGSWSKVKMEDGIVGWFYAAKFKWLE